MVVLLAAAVYQSYLSMQWHDIYLVEPVIKQIEVLSRCGDRERLEHIHSNCAQLLSAAKNLLDETDVADTFTCPMQPFSPPLADVPELDWMLNDLA